MFVFIQNLTESITRSILSMSHHHSSIQYNRLESAHGRHSAYYIIYIKNIFKNSRKFSVNNTPCSASDLLNYVYIIILHAKTASLPRANESSCSMNDGYYIIRKSISHRQYKIII